MARPRVRRGPARAGPDAGGPSSASRRRAFERAAALVGGAPSPPVAIARSPRPKNLDASARCGPPRIAPPRPSRHADAARRRSLAADGCTVAAPATAAVVAYERRARRGGRGAAARADAETTNASRVDAAGRSARSASTPRPDRACCQPRRRPRPSRGRLGAGGPGGGGGASRSARSAAPRSAPSPNKRRRWSGAGGSRTDGAGRGCAHIRRTREDGAEADDPCLRWGTLRPAARDRRRSAPGRKCSSGSRQRRCTGTGSGRAKTTRAFQHGA